VKLTEFIEKAADERVHPRFVRYLSSEGIIDGPDLSRGRANASYSEADLHGVVSFLHLRDLGFSLTQVKEIFKADRGETIPVEIGQGLTLHVDLARLDRAQSAADAAERVSQVLSEILSAMNDKGNDDAAA
jgi:DNA-binding transcriptional MerR regulator